MNTDTPRTADTASSEMCRMIDRINSLERELAEVRKMHADRVQERDHALRDRWKWESELAEARKENTYLRGILAKHHDQCLHCGLSDKSKCKSGFPGCAWGDDVLCANDEQMLDMLQKLTTQRAALEKAREALNRSSGLIPSTATQVVESREDALTTINAALTTNDPPENSRLIPRSSRCSP